MNIINKQASSFIQYFDCSHLNFFGNKGMYQDCPFYMEAWKGYKSTIDDITGH